jgi:hypothetical protein
VGGATSTTTSSTTTGGMSTREVRLGPPVHPNGPTAQAWILRELAKSEYAASRPTWFDDLATNIRDWLNSLFTPTVPGIPGLGPLVLVVIVAVVLVIAFLIFGLPRLNRRSQVTGELFGEDDRRTAAQILAAARAAAVTGDYSLAIVEGMRAAARTLGERTLLTMFPGTTAHEFARQAATVFPSDRARLESVATIFDGVRYLNEQGTEQNWRQTEQLAVDLRTARPANRAGDEGPGDNGPTTEAPTTSQFADA